jgi:pimeloyl-ACP methyl ester carboxylesterase
MLAFGRTGAGPPLILLHGTNSSRDVWAPVLPALVGERELIAIDLPGHGQSPPTSFTPPDWAQEVAALLDNLDLDRASVVGHSSGGWTALELAKLGRARAVLALAPAGLWRRHSPALTDAGLRFNWRLGQLLPEGLITKPLSTSVGRRMSLRQISVHPAQVPPEVAIATARAVIHTASFPEHFKRTRVLRFLDGSQIPPSVPVHVVWGAKDRIARARSSRRADQLPEHATVETWDDCGHMVMWDRPERLVEAMLALAGAGQDDQIAE